MGEGPTVRLRASMRMAIVTYIVRSEPDTLLGVRRLATFLERRTSPRNLLPPDKRYVVPMDEVKITPRNKKAP